MSGESDRFPHRFCPRCGLRLTAENPRIAGVCRWCAAERALGRPVTVADLTDPRAAAAWGVPAETKEAV